PMARSRPGPAQSQSGRSWAGATRLARRMGLTQLDADPAFAPYKRAAADFRRAQVIGAGAVGRRGHCGPAPASIIASAAATRTGESFSDQRQHLELVGAERRRAAHPGGGGPPALLDDRGLRAGGPGVPRPCRRAIPRASGGAARGNRSPESITELASA